MGGLAETQVVKAIEGLRSGQLDLLDTVIESDKPINPGADRARRRLQPHHRQAPAGRGRSAPLLGDQDRLRPRAHRRRDQKIAKAARRLHRRRPSCRAWDSPRRSSSRSSFCALQLDAFARSIGRHRDLRRKDAEIDAGFKGVMRQLITYMMEDPRTISSCLEMLFIAKAISASATTR